MKHEPDDLFKTALDGLPDAPPPGTAFDADALWGDLDRQLRPRRRLRAGWLAAACALLTVLAGLGWWIVGADAPMAPEGRAGRISATGKRVALPKKKVFTTAPVAKRAFTPPSRATSQRGTTTSPLPAVPMVPVVEAVPDLPEPVPTAVPEPEVAEQPVVALAKPGLSEKKTGHSKPRFRVVHANELPSGETIPMKPVRTEATARVTIGFDAALQAAPVEPLPVLILTKKPD